jgi:Raf kinase inhibitor-like YbhB/YbcL family protein
MLWTDAPDGTQSFAMVFIDENFNWLHWKLYNIDVNVSHIPENNPNDVGINGQSSFGINSYGGPCPPGNTPGNYVFTIHALNTVFNSEPSISQINAATIESDSWLAFRARNDSQVRYEYIAQYKLTFQAEWSNISHPDGFPGGAHFSPLFGGTHNDSGSFWKNGETSSNGVEQMAEQGTTTLLDSEVTAQIDSGSSESLIEGTGSSSTDSTVVFFDVSESHPLFSMVSMIAPSPDWFVGVHDLDLRENGIWKNNYSVDLFGYDAGTDNGLNYTSPNENTIPRDPIVLINSGPLGNGTPLGRFEFELISSAGIPTPDNIFNNGFE